MTTMSRNNSVSSFQGFSIFQPTLGAALQFLPAMGSAELDSMIDAYVPGCASILDKRAQITMDFYEFAAQTGENFKYYPLLDFTSVATDSPATSSLYDSGYGSSFNVSPIVTDLSWAAQTPSFTPSPPQSSAATQQSRTKTAASSSRKSSSASHRVQGSDFSHIPGMKIMTRDGVDVTNSATRGCKTKEQRDHAHLMRIIKACESCRKKKIRCDPSHRKRVASQASSLSPIAKPAKKTRKAGVKAKSPAVTARTTQNTASPSFDLSAAAFAAVQPSDSLADLFDQQDWEQFMAFNEPINAPAPDFNFFLDPHSYFTSSSAPSASSPQSFLSAPSATRSAPAYNHGGASHIESDPRLQPPYDQPGGSLGTYYEDFTLFSPESTLTGEDHRQRQAIEPTSSLSTRISSMSSQAQRSPQLPYLSNIGVAHGTDYVDFNLYSPASSFLDEEPRQLGARSAHESPTRHTPGGVINCSRQTCGSLPKANGLSHQLEEDRTSGQDTGRTRSTCDLILTTTTSPTTTEFTTSPVRPAVEPSSSYHWGRSSWGFFVVLGLVFLLSTSILHRTLTSQLVQNLPAIILAFASLAMRSPSSLSLRSDMMGFGHSSPDSSMISRKPRSLGPTVTQGSGCARDRRHQGSGFTNQTCAVLG